MSHFKLRKQNNCLNCGTFVHGMYCHNCGQENIEPKETFWHLITHFVYDITHFDGKFFSTVIYLLTRPGFLSKEYIKGKRMSYLNPIRLYVFVSAFFFLFFFSMVNPDFKSHEKDGKQEPKKTAALLKAEIKNETKELKAALRNPNIPIEQQFSIGQAIKNLEADSITLSKDSTALDHLKRAGKSSG